MQPHVFGEMSEQPFGLPEISTQVSDRGMMTQATLLYRSEGPVAVICFNDPGTLNAISPEMALELRELLARAESEARCVLLTGEGRGFCSGANLASGSAAALAAGDAPDLGHHLETAYNPLMRALRDHPTPVVTAVNGAAAGIGASIALMGDIILAAEGAYFLQAFINLGLVPDGGATFLLPHAVGRVRAMEMALLGERLPARTALEWGLINRIEAADSLQAEALALATRLAHGPTLALGLTRRLIWQSQAGPFDAQLDDERLAQRHCGHTADFAEGVAAFFAKRKPGFQGH